jgi:hypothetical protein
MNVFTHGSSLILMALKIVHLKQSILSKKAELSHYKILTQPI